MRSGMGRLGSSGDVVLNRKIVTAKADITGTLRSDTVYLIDGIIDMGSTPINVPEGGLVIQGLGFGISKLLSTEASYDMFINDPAGSYAGDLFLDSVEIEVSGVSSRVWNLSNDQNLNAVECTTANFINCTSLGELTDYRQGLWSNVALINCVDGVTCTGAWAGGFRATTAIIVNAGPSATFTGTLFKAGLGLLMSGRFLTDMNVEDIADTGTFCDFAPANIANKARFQIRGLSINPNANGFPNMPETDVKARFSKCDGTRNTYIGGQYTVSSEADTNCAVDGTLYKVAGTTAYQDLAHCSGAGDNAIRYDGNDEIGTAMFVTGSFTGPNNAEVVFVLRHYVDATSSYIDLSETGQITAAGTAKPITLSMHAFCDFAFNDRFELWCRIEGSTGNVRFKEGGLVSLNERAS